MNTPRILQLTLAVLKSRIGLVFMFFTFSAVIGFLISSTFPISIFQALKLIIVVTLVALSIYLNNDICDLEDDIKYIQFGKPEAAKRPLASGLISKKEMKIFVIFFGILGLSIAMLINIQALLAQLAFLALGLAYSMEPIKLKRRFMFKNLTIAMGGILSILTGGLAAGRISERLIFYIVISFFMYFGLCTLNDFRDMEWDKKIGVKSLPVILGPKVTIRIMLGVLFAVMGGFTLGYLRLGFNISFTVLGLIVLAIWIYSIYPLFNRYYDEKFIKKVLVKRSFPYWVALSFIILLIG